MNALSFSYSFIHFSTIGQYAAELLMIWQMFFVCFFHTTPYRWW